MKGKNLLMLFGCITSKSKTFYFIFQGSFKLLGSQAILLCSTKRHEPRTTDGCPKKPIELPSIVSTYLGSTISRCASFKTSRTRSRCLLNSHFLIQTTRITFYISLNFMTPHKQRKPLNFSVSR